MALASAPSTGLTRLLVFSSAPETRQSSFSPGDSLRSPSHLRSRPSRGGFGLRLAPLTSCQEGLPYGLKLRGQALKFSLRFCGLWFRAVVDAGLLQDGVHFRGGNQNSTVLSNGLDLSGVNLAIAPGLRLAKKFSEFARRECDALESGLFGHGVVIMLAPSRFVEAHRELFTSDRSQLPRSYCHFYVMRSGMPHPSTSSRFRNDWWPQGAALVRQSPQRSEIKKQGEKKFSLMESTESTGA